MSVVGISHNALIASERGGEGTDFIAAVADMHNMAEGHIIKGAGAMAALACVR